MSKALWLWPWPLPWELPLVSLDLQLLLKSLLHVLLTWLAPILPWPWLWPWPWPWILQRMPLELLQVSSSASVAAQLEIYQLCVFSTHSGTNPPSVLAKPISGCQLSLGSQQELEWFQLQVLQLPHQHEAKPKPKGLFLVLAWKMQVLLDRPREDFPQSPVSQPVLALV